MIKKLAVTVVVLVAIVGIAFAAYSNGNTKNSTNTINSTSPEKVNVNVIKNTTSNTDKTQSTISPAKAQEIAKTYIEVSGATPGSPELVTQEGKKVYMSM
jgi:cytoskeletal protein RodZ